MSAAGMATDAGSELLEHRHTCIHEAGHAAVARYYGLLADWVVYPNPTTDPYQQSRWGGFSIAYSDRWTRRIDRAFSLAGVIATALDDGPFITHWQIMEALDYGDIVLSPEDAEGAAGFKEKDVRDCLFFVSRLMPQISRDVGGRELTQRATPPAAHVLITGMSGASMRHGYLTIHAPSPLCSDSLSRESRKLAFGDRSGHVRC